jgi:hypothetical protein
MLVEGQVRIHVTKEITCTHTGQAVFVHEG